MTQEERHARIARAIDRERGRAGTPAVDRGAGAMNSPYEAANFSPRRGRVPGGSPADHKVDLPEWTRSELVKNSRYARKNSGLYREQVDLMHLYAVGPHGIKAQSQAENRDAAKAMELAFRDWGRIADITGRFTWAQVQRLVSACLDTDGEVYVLKTFHPVTKAPRLQLIESHRVGDFGKGDTWDGHKLNSYGQTVAVRVRQDSGVIRDIPSNQILHIFDPDAPSCVRNPPPQSHALHHLQDESEMLALEKHGVKDNSDIARVLKLGRGELDDDGDFSATGSVPAGTASDPKALQRIVGGKLVTIGPDETLESFESRRPSPTFTGFLEHIRREAVLGGLPYSITVDPSGINSGAVRVDVSKAQRRFEARQGLLVEKLIAPVWFFVIGAKIDRKELRASPNWWRITGGTPRQFTVDAGRNEESNRRDVAQGLKTPGDSYTEAGDDFLEAMERKAQEIAGLREIAARYGIPEEVLCPLIAGGGPKEAGAAGTPPSAKAR